MKFDIVHELPGRMRVRCRLARRAPECRLELERWLAEHDGLVSAAFSVRTGSLLVVYSCAVMKRESLLTVLDDLRLFGVATMVERDTRRRDAAANAVVRTCRRQAVSTFLRVFLPRPLFRLFGAWKAGTGVTGIVRALVRGDLAECCWRFARLAVMALMGNRMLVRVLLVVVLDAARASRSPAGRPEYGYEAVGGRGALRYGGQAQLPPPAAVDGIAI